MDRKVLLQMTKGMRFIEDLCGLVDGWMDGWIDGWKDCE